MWPSGGKVWIDPLSWHRHEPQGIEQWNQKTRNESNDKYERSTECWTKFQKAKSKRIRTNCPNAKMPMDVLMDLLINVDMKNNVAGPTGRQEILPKRGSLCLRNRCLGTTGGETRLQRFRVLSRAKNAFGVRIPALWKHTTDDAAKAALRVVNPSLAILYEARESWTCHT